MCGGRCSTSTVAGVYPDTGSFLGFENVCRVRKSEIPKKRGRVFGRGALIGSPNMLICFSSFWIDGWVRIDGRRDLLDRFFFSNECCELGRASTTSGMALSQFCVARRSWLRVGKLLCFEKKKVKQSACRFWEEAWRGGRFCLRASEENEQATKMSQQIVSPMREDVDMHPFVKSVLTLTWPRAQ